MLTGADPFPASHTAQQMFAITPKEPVPLPQIRPELASELETICLLGLLKPQSLRFQSARDFAAALREHLET